MEIKGELAKALLLAMSSEQLPLSLRTHIEEILLAQVGLDRGKHEQT